MSQDEGTDMTKNSPDTTSRSSESSSPDTGEAIDRILSDWQNWSATKLSETEMARLAYDVQELIRGEVVKAQLKRLKDYRLAWSGELSYEAKDSLNFQITELEATLSSGQTDGWEKQTWTR